MQAKPIKLLTLGELTMLLLLAFCIFYYREMAGVLSRHMLIHIVLMALVAPLVADAFRNLSGLGARFTGMKSLVAAALLQAGLFFAWHSPPGLAAIAQSGEALMQAALFCSALWFWLTVFNQAGRHLWRSVSVLLVTGKLFCLLAVLLTFAPRMLYGSGSVVHGVAADLADQQMAGLLMIIACPLTYVLAAIVLIYRWFDALLKSQGNSTPLLSASDNGS